MYMYIYMYISIRPTRYVHLLRFVLPESKKSMSLPGVAITISQPNNDNNRLS